MGGKRELLEKERLLFYLDGFAEIWQEKYEHYLSLGEHFAVEAAYCEGKAKAFQTVKADIDSFLHKQAVQ